MVPSVFNLVVCSVWDKTGDVWSHKLYDPNPAQCGYSLNGSTLLHEESCGIFKWFIPATWWPLVILHLLVLTTQTNIKRKSFVLIWVGIKGHHACNILKYNTLFIWIIPYTKYFVIREGRGGYKGGGGFFSPAYPFITSKDLGADVLQNPFTQDGLEHERQSVIVLLLRNVGPSRAKISPWSYSSWPWFFPLSAIEEQQELSPEPALVLVPMGWPHKIPIRKNVTRLWEKIFRARRRNYFLKKRFLPQHGIRMQRL